jgi:hypothetical protein
VWTLALFAGLGMVAATAWLIARRLAAPTMTGFVLSAYLAGFSEIVVLALALSAFRSLMWWTVLSGAGILLLAALALTRGVPPRTSLVTGVKALRAGLREPVVAALAIAATVGLAYSVILGVLTPPNDWDAMSYHLARAALWIQQESVAYVDNSPFAPINAYPPNAEIGALFTLILAHSDRFVGLVQYSAMLAAATATFGVARRVGIDLTGALFGALAFLTLPVVVLQSWTALNDLVVASFLITAVYFLLGGTRLELSLGGLSLALATGTKFTAIIALPVVLLVALAGQPRYRWPKVMLAFVAGAAAGSYWLVVNLVNTGSVDAGAAAALEQSPDRSAPAILARTTRMLVRFADSLALERDVVLFVIVGAVVTVACLVVDRPPIRRWPLVALGIGLTASVPVAMRTLGDQLLRAHEKVWLTLGSPELAFLDDNRDPHSPSTVFSYFGSLGFVLGAAGIVLGAIAVRRRSVMPVALALAGAPILFAFVLSIAITYDPFRGRFFLFSMALAASTWGLVLAHRWLAWGAAAIALVTGPLSFVHSTEKPLDHSIFDRGASSSVWGKSRETVQTWLRQDGTSEIVYFFAREPEHGRVGLRIRPDDWIYPYSGRTLGRDVVFVPDGSIDPSLDWLVVGPENGDAPGVRWSLVLQTDDGWRVYRPAGSTSQPSE